MIPFFRNIKVAGQTNKKTQVQMTLCPTRPSPNTKDELQL